MSFIEPDLMPHVLVSLGIENTYSQVDRDGFFCVAKAGDSPNPRLACCLRTFYGSASSALTLEGKSLIMQIDVPSGSAAFNLAHINGYNKLRHETGLGLHSLDNSTFFVWARDGARLLDRAAEGCTPVGAPGRLNCDKTQIFSLAAFRGLFDLQAVLPAALCV